MMIVDDHGNDNHVDDYDHDGVNAIGWESYNDDDNDVDDDNHPDPMIIIVDDGVNAIGWQSYNNVDNHDDDDPYTK